MLTRGTTMKTLATALLLLATAACSSEEAPIGPDPTAATSSGGEGGGPTDSGTRLRARRIVAEDGATQFVGWRDTQRDEDCAFREAADGKLRCVPDLPVVATTTFSDAACSAPLLNNAAGCTAEGATVLVRAEACGGGFAVWKVGGLFTGQDIYRWDGDSCEPSVPGEQLWAAASQVDASSFVAAVEQVD